MYNIPVHSMIAIQDNIPVDCTVGVDAGFIVGELVKEGSGSSAQERLDKSIVTYQTSATIIIIPTCDWWCCCDSSV